MSTFLGMVGGEPLLHMTTDTRTQAQMQGAPGPTTIFHSDLPYVLVREQFTLDSYQNYNNGGGRTFLLPSELQTFKTNNPYLAHLLVLEDNNGSKWVHNPMLNALGVNLNNGFFIGEFCAAANGAEYFTAFTTSDSQLDAMSDNEFMSQINLIFRPWDVGDTRVTVFRCPDMAHRFGQYGAYTEYNENGEYDNVCEGEGVFMSPQKWESTGLDVVKVHFVFLNVLHSPTEFNDLPDFDSSQPITLNPDEFSVGGINMLVNQPLITRGKFDSGDTVTPLYGQVAGGKRVEFSTEYVGKVSSSNVVDSNNTPVIEYPNAFTPSSKMEFDLLNKTIKRDGDVTFSASALAQGLQVIGTKKIVLSAFSESATENLSRTSTIATTQTGSFDSPNADCLYLASVVYGGEKAHSAAIFSVGNNTIADFAFSHFEFRPNVGRFAWGINTFWYLEIDASGNCTVKRFTDSTDYLRYQSISYTFDEELEIRLIGLKPS